MPLIPLLIVLGIGALVANSVRKARKRDAAFITTQFKREMEAREAQNRG